MRHIFRLIFIVFFLISLPVISFATFTSYPPAWINDHQNGSLKQAGFYHGVSFADYKGSTPRYDGYTAGKRPRPGRALLPTFGFRKIPV